MEKISIVVPVYNVENYLKRCVDSLCAQTYQNIEILLVNDGSTDDSLNLCHELQKLDNRISVYTKPNGGLSDARNYGMQYCDGEYLMFVDSDDWIDHTMAEKMIRRIHETGAEIVCCDLEYVYDNGERTVTSGGAFTVLHPTAMQLDFMTIPPSACNKLFKKDLFKDFTFPKGYFYEDLATTPVLMARCSKIAKVDEALYKYWQRSGSITHQETDRIFYIYDAIERISKNFPEEFQNDKMISKIHELLIVHGLDLTTLRISSFKNQRISYYDRNMKKLSYLYPDWYSNPLIHKMGLKKTVLFTLLKMRQYRIVDKLLTRKYEN